MARYTNVPTKKNIEKIEKQGDLTKVKKKSKKQINKKLKKLLEKESNAKTFKTWLEAKRNQVAHQGNREIEFLLNTILEKYNEFESVGISYPEQWQGKSSIELIKKPDRIIAIKYQKPNKDEEPKPVKTEITKEQINCVIGSLNKYKDLKSIKTKLIARDFSDYFKLNHNTWNQFFSDRHNHNLLTIILGVLDKEGLIEYSAGKSKVLKNHLDIQQIL